jgi:hypothetical protein
LLGITDNRIVKHIYIFNVLADNQEASFIPFTYYLDEDASGTVGSTEVQSRPSVRMGR